MAWVVYLESLGWLVDIGTPPTLVATEINSTSRGAAATVFDVCEVAHDSIILLDWLFRS